MRAASVQDGHTDPRRWINDLIEHYERKGKTVHWIKCHAAYFDRVENGQKPFEVRRDDRGYNRGDLVILVRTIGDPIKDAARVLHAQNKGTLRPTDFEQTGFVAREVGFVLTGGQYGIEPGYVVFATRYPTADLAP